MKRTAWARTVGVGVWMVMLGCAAMWAGAQGSPPVSPVERVHASREALGRGDLAAALACADQAIAADPAFGEGWKQRARSLMLLDRSDEAAQSFDRALKLLPADADLRTWSDLLALQGSDIPELVRRLREWPADRMRLLDERMVARFTGRMSEAGQAAEGEAFLRRWASSAGAGSPDTARKLADILSGGPRDLTPLLDDSVLKGPGALRDLARYELGMNLLRSHHLEAAQKAFAWALREHPDWMPALREMGWTHRRMGDAAAAIESWRGGEKNPSGVSWGNWISDAWLDLNQPDRAMEAVNRVLDSSPEDVDALERKYSLLLRTGEMDAAKDVLGRLQKLPDGDHHAAFASARADLALARPANAVATLDKIWKEHPDDSTTRALLVRALVSQAAALENPPEAIPVLRRVIELDSGLPGVWRDLGWRLWAVHEKTEAMTCFETALAGGLAEARSLVVQVYALLAEDKTPTKAIAFLDRHLPGESRLAVGMELVKKDRAAAAIPALDVAWKRGEKPERTGLYLAFARIVTGAGYDVAPLLKPALEKNLEQWDDYDCEMTLETLRQAADTNPDPALMKSLADRTKPGTPVYARVTGLLARAAARLRAMRKFGEAAEVYQRVLDRDADRFEWPEAMDAALLANRSEGADAMLQSLLTRAKNPAIREGVEGRIAEREGRWSDAVASYESSIRRVAEQPLLRWSLFQTLVKLGRYSEAEAQAGWFAERAKAEGGENETRLAEIWTLLNQPARALPYWKRLHGLYPDSPYFTLETARAHFALGQPAEAEKLLDEAARRFSDIRVFEAGAEIQAALGKPERVIEWADRGLALGVSPELLQLKAESSDLLNRPAEAMASAQALLGLQVPERTEPAIRILGAQWMRVGKRDEARRLYAGALAENPDLHMARLRLREIATLDGRPREAAAHAEYMTEGRPWDIAGWQLRAASLAEAGKFRSAIQMLEPRVDLDPADAVPVLVYRRLTAYDYPGRNTLRQLAAHLEWLSHAGYRFVLPEDLAKEHSGRSVIVVLVEPEPQTLAEVDALLERFDARVVHARRTAPGSSMPYAGAGKSAARWKIASSGPLSPAIVPGHAAEMETALTRRLRVGDRMESDVELKARLERVLSATAQSLAAVGPAILVYPGGDYGNHAPSADPTLLGVLRKTAAAHFAQAIFYDESGFAFPGADPLRIPARVVPPDWDAPALAERLKSDNPIANAQLQLAKILSWHQQNEKAEYWFARAATHGAPPLDTALNRGMNAWRAGDPDRARRLLTEAQKLDPESETIAGALREIRLGMAPRIEAAYQTWYDSDDRSFQAFTLHASSTLGRPSKPEAPGHRARLEVLSERRTYELKGASDMDAWRIGAGGQLRLAPETYADAAVWHEMYAGTRARDFTGGYFGFRIPVRAIGGYANAAFERDTLETLEAVRSDIQQRKYSGGAYARVFDVFDLFANGAFMDRDDHNQTWTTDGRFLYRVTEWPYFGVGYAWRFGDSDADPPEYYAPMNLEQHQLYVGLRGTWRQLHFIGSVQAGYSRETGRGWEWVWGGRLRLEADLTHRLLLFAEANRMESSTYDRNGFQAGVEIRL